MRATGARASIVLAGGNHDGAAWMPSRPLEVAPLEIVLPSRYTRGGEGYGVRSVYRLGRIATDEASGPVDGVMVLIYEFVGYRPAVIDEEGD